MMTLLCIVFSSLSWAVDSFNNQLKTPPVHAPTIYLEKTPPQPPKKPKVPQPIFLDARPAFDFALGHLPHSISIRWQDYSQTEEPHRGALDPDVGLLSRKLRYLGINPESQVIILGLGPRGTGEEGRVGWMLSYLGVKKVQIKNLLNISARKTTDSDFENESTTPWNPKVQNGLRTKKSDLIALLNKSQKDFVLIDVRKKEDFAKHIPGALSIPWTEFADSKGEIISAPMVNALFKSHGVDVQSRLIFYSDKGITSGYAAFACLEAGLNCSHYDGSFDEWAADPQAPVTTDQGNQNG